LLRKKVPDPTGPGSTTLFSSTHLKERIDIEHTVYGSMAEKGKRQRLPRFAHLVVVPYRNIYLKKHCNCIFLYIKNSSKKCENYEQC
jgi:hypothetical protein